MIIATEETELLPENINLPSANVAENHENDLNYKKAFKDVIKRAVPYTGSQIILNTSDILSVKMMSELGNNILAASNIITSIQECFSVTVAAGFSSTSILVAKKIGENNVNELNHVGMILRQSWFAGMLASIPNIGIALFCKPILLGLDQPEDLANLSQKYFYVYSLALPVKVMLSINRKFTLATENAFAGFIIDIFSKSLNLGLAYGLMFGKLGLPDEGLVGLAIANVVSTYVTFAGSTLYLFSSSKYKDYGLNKFNYSEEVSYFKELWKVGSPISLKVGIELGATLASSLMIGAFGQNQLAADEAAFQYIYLLSTPMFSLMETVSALVSLSVGQGNFDYTRKIANSAAVIGLSLSLLGLILFTTIPDQLLSFFIENNNHENDETLDLAKSLLLISGLSLLPDIVRNIYSGGLSGYKDSLTPSLIISLTTLLLNIPLACTLAFPLNFKAKGVVIAKGASITVGAGLMAGFWNNKVNQNKALKLPLNRANTDNRFFSKSQGEDSSSPYSLLEDSDTELAESSEQSENRDEHLESTVPTRII